jgi:ubiquinone/menaquinone biosynthesis C-methylase UbiE
MAVQRTRGIGSVVMKKKRAHSEEYFGEQRDFWWRPDFLRLLARRWRLSEASSMADVGCGLGHWSMLLYPLLKPHSTLAAVDAERKWIKEARARFYARFPTVNKDLFTFKTGDAADLPLPSDAYDVVTCQTVLMHLRDPLAALREMARVAKPGGIIIAAEPNNFFNIMAFSSLTALEPVDSIVQRFEFWLRYHRGKKMAGAGDNTIGDLLPGMFGKLGLTDISVSLSDRAAPLIPPYDNHEEKVMIQQAREWKKAGRGLCDAKALLKYAQAGGASTELLKNGIQLISSMMDKELAGIEEKTFHTAGGGLHYLISGRKP